ncbi:DUF2378 family protein [Aggregicoccus sp. 17bor-14]|uniref:DUF2378 family protein n=1 Tax=Myxococcaceae TaxID=31 RepID=UPI00129C75B4|nr:MULTISPECIES: DUF2378 family protein [Myxococcaceae]MBF5044645.1 DUF2378 family protein [Simulacricoccus sp. 17bor-14]MRI90389.1 DUF2378 family protein [Aggregicoccus sp. 17bor-14]
MAPPARIIFGNTFAGLYRHVAPQVPGATLDRLRERGVDFRRPVLPAYPAELFVVTVQELAAALHPQLPQAEALRLLGRAVLDGYLATPIGRAVRGVARLIGTRRTLLQMSKNFRSSDTFTQTRLTARGERDVSLWLNDALGMPSYYRGFFEGVVEGSGGTRAQVEVESYAPPEATLRIRWEER